MNDRTQGGGTAIYVLGTLAEGVFGMAFTIILVRLITPDEFGAWRQFMVLAGIVWSVATYGLSRSLGYYFSVAPAAEQGAIARRTLLVCGVLGVVSVVLFYLILPFAAERFESPALADEALLFSLYLGLNFPVQVVITLLLAAGRRRQLAGAKLTFALLRLAALLALLWGEATLRVFLLAVNCFAAAQLLIMLVLYLRAAGPVVAPLWQNVRTQFQYALNLTGQSVAGQIAVEADKLLVSSSFPPAKFAAYSVGARELPLVPIIPFSITDSIAPELSRMAVARKMTEFREFWHRWIRRAALLMYPVFALVLFQSEPVVTVLFTAEYLDGALPLLIIGCLIPLRVTSFYQILLCLNDSRAVMWASVATLIGNVSLSLLFMKLFGLWGPALGVLMTEYVVNSVVVVRISKRSEIKLTQVLPWSYLLKLLLIAVGSGALALPVLGLLPEAATLIRLVAYGLVMLVLYGAAALSLSMVDAEDLALVRARIRR